MMNARNHHLRLLETVTISGTITQGFTDTTTLNQQTTETVVAHATKPGPCNISVRHM